jgi:hypothetical protein
MAEFNEKNDDWENEGDFTATAVQKLSQLCLYSLILGILSPICCGCLTGIPAVILGHMGLSEVGDESGPLRGRGMALAGLVLGYISIVITVLSTFFALVTGSFAEILNEFERAF